LDWQISAISQVLGSFPSSLATLESLAIAADKDYWLVGDDDWQVDDDNSQDEIEDIPWREVLHPFIAVKEVTLKAEDSDRLVAHAIQELSRESTTQVLPALQNVFLRMEYWPPSGPVKEAIGQFTVARQRCDHPVAVHHWDGGSGKYVL
jgi:hypothetical protein